MFFLAPCHRTRCHAVGTEQEMPSSLRHLADKAAAGPSFPRALCRVQLWSRQGAAIGMLSPPPVEQEEPRRSSVGLVDHESMAQASQAQQMCSLRAIARIHHYHSYGPALGQQGIGHTAKAAHLAHAPYERSPPWPPVDAVVWNLRASAQSFQQGHALPCQ